MNIGPGTLAQRMASAARELHEETSPQATMDMAARLAVQNVRGCDAAAVSLVTREGRVATAAHTDDLALSGDLLQYELQEGPCLQAIWDERVLHSADLELDDRWPTWGPRVARELGARSMLAVKLFTGEDTVGALNLYALRRGAFDEEARDDGLALAAHVAIAITSSRRTEQLTHALDTRTVIGQACGVLMERYDLEPARAFQLLSRVSSTSNTKLRDVARELVETRLLPEDR